MKNSNKIEIVSDSKTSSRKPLIIIISIIVAVALAVTATIIIINVNKKPDDWDKYEQVKDIYDDNDIVYTYDDYKKDEEANKNNDSNNVDNSNNSYSEAKKELENKGNDLLKDMENDTLIKSDLEMVKSSIINQIKDMNEFISNHCGFPDSKYGEDYRGVTSYIDSIINSMSGGAAPESLYGESVEQLQAEVRYSILHQIQYRTGNGYTQFNRCLKNWMSYKHPKIDKIETIAFENGTNEMFDDIYFNNLNAKIVSNGIRYKIYLSSQVYDNGEAYYKILDIEKY